jgi:hypothetical protein
MSLPHNIYAGHFFVSALLGIAGMPFACYTSPRIKCQFPSRKGATAMFRLWAKTFKNARMLKDVTIEDASEDTRTHKVLRAMEQVCRDFDLSSPIWLEKTIREFKKHAKARFTQDNFMETIDFDYLEIQIIEED